ncbi:MAG: hypothetical protein ABIR63_05320 [Sphingomicrobium sp.]
MKKLRIVIAATALAMSTHAYAMPPQVPGIWYSMMDWVVDVVSGSRHCSNAFDQYCI